MNETQLSNIMFMAFFVVFFFKMRNIFPLNTHQDLQFDTKPGYLLRLTPNDPIGVRVRLEGMGVGDTLKGK